MWQSGDQLGFAVAVETAPVAATPEFTDRRLKVEPQFRAAGVTVAAR